MPYLGKQIKDGCGEEEISIFCMWEAWELWLEVKQRQTIFWGWWPSSYAFSYTFLIMWPILLPLRQGLCFSSWVWAGADVGLQLTTSQKPGLSVSSTRKWICQMLEWAFKLYFPPAESPKKSECSPANTLIAALWDPKQRTQGSHVQTPNHQKSWDNCMLLKALSVR